MSRLENALRIPFLFHGKVILGSVPADTPGGLVAYAVGVIRDGARLDVWKIDDPKEFSNVQAGL